MSQFDDFSYLIERRPLLAHYTSLVALEAIMKSDELWFSNPLFMNDLEEVRFGINQGQRLFLSVDLDAISGNRERASLLRHAFQHYYNQFDNAHLFDTYVFCLSEHDRGNRDGLLSMWRGYGGFGGGVALVFNTDIIRGANEQSPLMIAKVRYASSEERLSWLTQQVTDWGEILKKTPIPDDKLYLAAYALFGIIKHYALVSKHDGFREEQEWRLIYLPERDTAGHLKDRLGYALGARGVEPKLKVKIGPQPWTPNDAWTFAQILDRIILGPSVSSPLARMSVNRMLEMLGKPEFSQKLCPSTIPLRPEPHQ